MLRPHSSYIHPPSSINCLDRQPLPNRPLARSTNSAPHHQYTYALTSITKHSYHNVLRFKINKYNFQRVQINFCFIYSTRCLHSAVDVRHLINSIFERGKVLSFLSASVIFFTLCFWDSDLFGDSGKLKNNKK